MKTYDRQTSDSEFVSVTLVESVDLHTACRLCLSSNEENQIHIFKGDDTLATMLSYFLNFKIHEGDGLPAKICQSCHTQLYTSYDFYLKCQETEALLYQLVNSQNLDSSTPIVTLDDVKNDQLLIKCPENKGSFGSRGRLTDTYEMLKLNEETTDSLVDSQDEDNVPSVECGVNILENDSNIPNSGSFQRHSASVGPFTNPRSCDSKKYNAKDKHVDYHSHCNKTNLNSPSSGLYEPNGSLRSPSKKTFRSKADNNCKVISVHNGDNANDDVSYTLSSVEIDTNIVPGEEIMLVELFPEFGDDKEFDNERENTMEGNSESETATEGRNELETGEIVDFVGGSEVGDPSQEAYYGIFSDECLYEMKDDLRVLQSNVAEGKAQRLNNERMDVHMISGPIRMDLHPACVSVCKFVCRICGEAFMHRSDLKLHETLHSRRQGLECSVCYKYFSCNYKLEEHMRIHTGVKPYTCAVCDMSFTQRGALQNHMKKHSKARPYVCCECGRSYYNREGLKVHMRLHKSDPLDIDLNECPLCDKAFVYPSGLSRHLALHSSRSFTCDLCHKNYRELPTLKRHMLIKHGFG